MTVTPCPITRVTESADRIAADRLEPDGTFAGAGLGGVLASPPLEDDRR